MAQQPYGRFPAIGVNDSRPFHTKVTNLLDTIAGTAVGQSMLTQIQQSGKRVDITMLRPGTDTGNKCVAHNIKKFVRLRQAFTSGHDPAHVSLREELQHTLSRAEAAGHSRLFICKQLAQGLTPATVRTANNLTHVPHNLTRANVADNAWAVAQILEKITRGTIRPDEIPTTRNAEYTLVDNLIRILKPWLRPGDGSNCGIYFDPDNQASCAGDRGMAWRPPGIGLAHELCHAWRNVTGNRLFDDAQACGLSDDEVMTTGIPPYNAEQFSENRFRSVWTLSNWERWRHWINELPMRDSYR